MRLPANVKHALSRAIRRFSYLRKISRLLITSSNELPFQSSDQYWRDRYERGGDSGEGSYGPLAKYKSAFLNAFAAEKKLSSVIEIGCGDGNQAAQFSFTNYTGVDISQKCIDIATRRLSRPGWSFITLDQLDYSQRRAFELGISLDVIYHLTEDDTYYKYLETLFRLSARYVIIYASNFSHFDPDMPHVRHRHFTADVEQRFPDWRFVEDVKNPFSKVHNSTSEYGSFASFHVFEPRT